MKKNLLLAACLVFALLVNAEVSKTLNVPTAGSLSTLLTDAEETTITNLTLTGVIDSSDLVIMRDKMPVLAVLDLEKVAISGNVIPIHAFYNKTSLDTLTLPVSITSIRSGALCGCSGLTSLTIPNSVTSVGDSAFYGCSSLLTIHLSMYVNIIGDWAFGNCQKLEKIILPSPIPPSIKDNTLFGVDCKNCVLYVSNQAKQTYQNAADWNKFVCIVEEDFANTFYIYMKISTGGIVKFKNATLWNDICMLVQKDSTMTFTITPDPGYEIATLSFRDYDTDIKSQIVNNQFTTPPAVNSEILYVIFQKSKCLISFKSAENGSTNLQCEYGFSTSFRFTPSDGWKVHSVSYNGTDVTDSLVNGTYKLPPITENVQLNVSYEPIIQESESSVKVLTNQSDILVDGTLQGEIVKLYTIGGVELTTVQSQGCRITFHVQEGATYLVKTVSKLVKVAL